MVSHSYQWRLEWSLFESATCACCAPIEYRIPERCPSTGAWSSWTGWSAPREPSSTSATWSRPSDPAEHEKRTTWVLLLYLYRGHVVVGYRLTAHSVKAISSAHTAAAVCRCICKCIFRLARPPRSVSLHFTALRRTTRRHPQTAARCTRAVVVEFLSFSEHRSRFICAAILTWMFKKVRVQYCVHRP